MWRRLNHGSSNGFNAAYAAVEIRQSFVKLDRSAPRQLSGAPLESGPVIEGPTYPLRVHSLLKLSNGDVSQNVECLSNMNKQYGFV